MSEESLNNPGDVLWDELFLTTANGEEVDLANFVMELNLYEDIYAPILYGDLAITDAVNAITNFPIRGGEIVTFKIRTPTFEDSKSNILEKSFSIYSIENRIQSGDREQFYVLKFCSIEGLVDNFNHLAVHYSGKTDDIVEKIWNDTLGQPRRIDSEDISVLSIGDTPHQSEVEYVSNFWSPFQNMMFLSKRATGGGLEGNDFLFFESNKSFYFTSIQALIKEQKEELFDEYHINPQGLTKPHRTGGVSYIGNLLPDGFNNISSMGMPSTVDLLVGASSGMLAASTRAFDYTTKETKEWVFDMRKDFAGFVHTDDGVSIPEGIPRDPYAYQIFKPTSQGNYGKVPYGIAKFGKTELLRQGYLAGLTQYTFEIDVSGRTDIQVGVMIRINYPNVGDKTGDGETPAEDPILSGNYLVTAIKHKIDYVGHTMKMEVVKNGLAENLGQPGDDNV